MLTKLNNASSEATVAYSFLAIVKIFCSRVDSLIDAISFRSISLPWITFMKGLISCTAVGSYSRPGTGEKGMLSTSKFNHEHIRWSNCILQSVAREQNAMHVARVQESNSLLESNVTSAPIHCQHIQFYLCAM